MQLLWSAGSVVAARTALALAVPQVLLVDLGLPDGSGLDIIRELRTDHPDSEAMVVSIFGDEGNVVAAIEAGASGYLLKDTLAEPFLTTIRELHAGGSPISPSIARILLMRARATHPVPIDNPEGTMLAERENTNSRAGGQGIQFRRGGAAAQHLDQHRANPYLSDLS